MSQAEIFDITTGRRLPNGRPETTEQITGDILSLCAEFDALNRQKVKLFDAIRDDKERECLVDAIEVQQEPIVYRLANLRATSIEELYETHPPAHVICADAEIGTKL